jgi:hypothetical protein
MERCGNGVMQSKAGEILKQPPFDERREAVSEFSGGFQTKLLILFAGGEEDELSVDEVFVVVVSVLCVS